MTVRLPASVYGPFAQVKRALGPAMRTLAKGATFDHALGAELLDVEQHEGLIVLDGPSPLLAGLPHFHAYLPWSLAEDAANNGQLTDDVLERVFRESLDTHHGFLGLLAQKNVMWVFPPERHRLFLASAVRFWEDLDSIGTRYTVGSNAPERLWITNQNLKFVLANHGVDDGSLSSPVNRTQVRELVSRVLADLTNNE